MTEPPPYFTDDTLYMQATSQSLHALVTVFHGALRFITNSPLRGQDCLLLTVPRVTTEKGKKAFQYAAPHVCGRNCKRASDFVSVKEFKEFLNNLYECAKMWMFAVISLLFLYFRTP